VAEEKKEEEETKRKKWIYIRDHDSAALVEFRRAENRRGESYQELPESARLAASLRAFSTGRGYCSHERATMAATITSPSASWRTTSLCSLLLAACGWFVLLARYLPGTCCIFNPRDYFTFALLDSAFAMHTTKFLPESFKWKII
jgi:hypothetical protein